MERKAFECLLLMQLSYLGTRLAISDISHFKSVWTNVFQSKAYYLSSVHIFRSFLVYLLAAVRKVVCPTSTLVKNGPCL